MQDAAITVNKSVAMERNSITPEWVNAQTRANRQASLGLTASIAAPGIGAALILGWGIDTVALMLGVAGTIGVIRYGWLNNVVFTQSEFASDEERARMEQERNDWYVRYEEANQEAKNNKAKVDALTGDNESYRNHIRKLEANLVEAKKFIAQQRKQPTEQIAQLKVDPGIFAAQTIVRNWFLDVDQEAHPLVSRAELMKQGIERNRIEEGWHILKQIEVADKADNRPNAKWVITLEDEYEIDQRLTDYANRSEGAEKEVVLPLNRAWKK